jgi:hypothetical protein
MLPFYNMIAQSSSRTESELIHLKNSFYTILERDLSTSDRVNSRELYLKYYPTHMLSSFLNKVNARYSVYANDIEDQRKIQNILSYHKVFFQNSPCNSPSEFIDIFQKLQATEDPQYNKGWNQYRMFLDVLKSSVRSQLAQDEDFFMQVFVPFSSSSMVFRDYFIVKYIKFEELTASKYRKNIFHVHLSSFTKVRVGTHNLDTRDTLFVNTRLSHSRVSDTITLSVDILSAERSLMKSFQLQDMEKFIKDAPLEYRPLCRRNRKQ